VRLFASSDVLLSLYGIVIIKFGHYYPHDFHLKVTKVLGLMNK
jgi:hypothetical protein